MCVSHKQNINFFLFFVAAAEKQQLVMKNYFGVDSDNETPSRVSSLCYCSTPVENQTQMMMTDEWQMLQWWCICSVLLLQVHAVQTKSGELKFFSAAEESDTDTPRVA